MKKIILQPKITIEFPYIQKTDDYHEFEMIHDQHEDMLGRKIYYQELGCAGLIYRSIFYIPENELTILDIKKMLMEEGLGEGYIEEVTENLEI